MKSEQNLVKSKKRALVLIASEQVWPSVQSLFLATAFYGPISDIFIYYTADERRSRMPASRLKSFFSELEKQTFMGPWTVHLESVPGSALPEGVDEQLDLWEKKHQGRTWILNATGGTKLMSSAFWRRIGDRDTIILYRELSLGCWFECTKEEGKHFSKRIEFDDSVTNIILVEDLLRLQCLHSGSTLKWNFSVVDQALNVPALTRSAIKQNWNWKEVFAACDYDCTSSVGLLFEKYMAAVLLALGVKRVLQNICLIDTAHNTTLFETDLVFHLNGMLYIVDCKLRTAEEEQAGRALPMTSQIREAAQTRRLLGGLAATYILVRPNRVFSDEEHAFASAQRLEVVDSSRMGTLFSDLSDKIGLRCPPELACLEKELGSYLSLNRVAPFTPLLDVQKVTIKNGLHKALFDMELFAREAMLGANKKWFCARIFRKHYVLLLLGDDEPSLKALAMVDSLLKQMNNSKEWLIRAHGKRIDTKNNKKYCFYNLHIQQKSEQWLELIAGNEDNAILVVPS